MMTDYALLDSGNGRKLERFGPVVLARPCAQAVWTPQRPEADWRQATAAFDREDGLRWQNRGALPDQWIVEVDGLRFRLSGTDFGHLGIFPEQRAQWRWIGERLGMVRDRRPRVLNLFAYSGGATLAAARAGAEVCHLDASRGMVDWARENAALNKLPADAVRWMVDDAIKFVRREQRRGSRYDGIILDPPTFGRGRGGEVFKIERDLPALLDDLRALLTDAPCFMLLSAHTPGFSPVIMGNLLRTALAGAGGVVTHGEMLLEGGAQVLPVPSGAWARWRPDAPSA
jgi:23S rRNA (cytosine1962-C5)-methyltransferase